ncbi:MAG: hypothetical protein ACOC41_01520 [Chitinivibrionales bacterium]
MFWDIFLALSVGIILTALFAVGLRRPGPWASVLAFFFIVFLTAWAGGIWALPIGPTIGATPVLPIVVVGVIFALLLAAATPPHSRPTISESSAVKEAGQERATQIMLDVFFWIALILLVLLVAFRYTTNR